MTNAASSLVTLRTNRVQLTLAAAVGQRPSILYWGDALHDKATEDLSLLTTRPWAFGGPSRDIAPSLSNELGAGLGAPSGFNAHRNGSDWAAVFTTQEVEATDERMVVVRCHDLAHTIGIDYHLELDPDTHVLSVVSKVTNKGSAPLTVDWAAAITLPLDQRLTRLWGFTGRWANEFQIEEINLHGGSYVRDNTSGRTSHDSFPGLIALTPQTNQSAGLCAGFHLAWSGNHRIRVDQHTNGFSFVQAGELFFPGEIHLNPNEVYTSPTVYAAWSNSGLNALSRSFHRHLKDRILDQRTRNKPRPVHYNTWEAVYFDHSEDKLLKLASEAASVGTERFVLDDGWFGGRRNDAAGLGDWVVASDIYPRGLHKLVDHVRSLGMEFGVWFEPEMVNPDSDLFRSHPDWVLEARGVEQVPYRQQYTLDLTRPEVTEYLFDAINNIVSTYDVDYIKWDMNRDVSHPGDQDGKAATHRQTMSVYSLIKRIRDEHPRLEIESCASGGGRADFGVLAHTDRLWTSDNNDALVRQSIQRGASYFFPLQVLGSHVGPKTCHITGRVHDMAFRVGTAFFGHMGMEVDLASETAEDIAILKKGVALYKEHRDLVHNGDFYRLEAINAHHAVGVVKKDKSEALFSCSKTSDHRTTLPERVRFVGLSPRLSYRVRIIWPGTSPAVTAPSIIEAANLYGEGHIFSGQALEEIGIQPPLINPNTCLIFHLQATTDH
ncbi:MAG: alpha-galactosidase [Pseudomonadota bacterium]